MKKGYSYIILFYLFLSLLLLGCESSEQQIKHTDDDLSEEQNTEHNIEEVKKIFFMLPSPIETASLIKKTGAQYDGSVLNPVQNVSKYETTTAKALNLGVYAADLSIASVFDQTQEGMLFVMNCKKLSDELGISEAFNAQTMESIEANINDKDSLLYLISDSYWQTDAYLQENNLASLSALIIAGGWVEGLYAAIQLEKRSNSKLLKRRIAEQKFPLSHLLEILTTYKEEDKIQRIYEDLLNLNSIFNKIKTTKTEPIKNKNVIGASNELNLTDNVLLEIENKTTEIRNNYINS